MAKVTLNIYGVKFKFDLTSQQETTMKAGHALKYNYQPNLPNPAFDPGIAIDPVTNPQQIPNPMSKEKYLCSSILSDILSRYWERRLEEVQRTKQTEAQAAIATEKLTPIVVVEDLAS